MRIYFRASYTKNARFNTFFTRFPSELCTLKIPEICTLYRGYFFTIQHDFQTIFKRIMHVSKSRNIHALHSLFLHGSTRFFTPFPSGLCTFKIPKIYTLYRSYFCTILHVFCTIFKRIVHVPKSRNVHDLQRLFLHD